MNAAVRTGPRLSPPTEFAVGDVLQLRKPHPCGGAEWRVVRLGADIGLRCLTCQHKVLLPRRKVERRMKRFVARASDAEAAESPAAE